MDKEIPCGGGTIIITSSAINALPFFLKQHSSCIVISDRQIFDLYGNALMEQLKLLKLHTFPFLLESGEKAKTLESAEKCWQEMHRNLMDRSALVIGFGGGVVTDIAGFVASCYMRGVDLILIPTTLLGMVDAAIGGKNGVNLSTGKNLIGTITQPKAVLIDLNYLSSLPKSEFSAGMAEVIKHGVIKRELFEFLETHMTDILNFDEPSLEKIIAESCKLKAEIVHADEKETYLRQILNFGHTFGHALETATNYSKYLHGEAVSIGMCCAAETALRLGMVDSSFVKRLENLCQMAGLPTHFPSNIDKKQLMQLMQGDKKSVAGKIHLILPEAIGKVRTVQDAHPDIIYAALEARQV